MKEIKRNQPQKLGRGLKALFGDHDVQEEQPEEKVKSEEVKLPDGVVIQEVEIEKIKPNPYQPRKEFKPEEIEELATTIKKHGLIQPIYLRKHEDMYQIVSGERRFRACQHLGFETIQAKVNDRVSDKQMAELALIENIQRVQLSAIEEAVAYEQLIQEYGYTHEEVATTLGKSRSVITNTLRLIKLPEAVKGYVSEGKISAGHARLLLRDEVGDPEALANEIIKKGYSVRQVEEITSGKKVKDKAPKQIVNDSRDPNIVALEKELEYALGSTVELKGSADNGRIEIQYHGLLDLQRVTEIIKEGSKAIL